MQQHRLALVLLGALAGLLLLGAAVPQQGTTPPIEYARWRQQYAPFSSWLEMAGLTAAARAPWLPLVAVPLMASLAHCTARRLVALGRLWHLRGLSRAWLARLGSVVFHGSLLAALVALLLSGATRFAGQAELAPGQHIVDQPERYLVTEAGWWPPAPTGLTIQLDDLRLDAWPDGSLKEQAATFSALRDGRLLAQVEVARSQPVDLAGLTVVLGPQAGPAVLLVIEDAAGRRGGWVHFPNWPGDRQADLTFAVPQTPTRLAARLDRASVAQPETAVLTLRPVGEAGAGGNLRLKLGEAAPIGPYQMRFAAIDGWTSLTIVRDAFVFWAFGALGVGLAGLALATLAQPSAFGQPRSGVRGALAPPAANAGGAEPDGQWEQTTAGCAPAAALPATDVGGTELWPRSK